MTNIDFHARAELYLGSDWHAALAQGARSFRTTAHAILFAVEHAAPVSLHGARLTIGDQSFSGDQFADLYRSPDFPLPRKTDAPKARSARRKINEFKGDTHGHRLRRTSGSVRRQALRQERVSPVQALQFGL